MWRKVWACRKKLGWQCSSVQPESMAAPRILTGSSFKLLIMCVVLVYRIEQWLNFDNIFENIRRLGSALIALVSHSGQGFLYKHIISTTSLVSDSFGRKTIDMYIVRKMQIKRRLVFANKKKYDM